MHHHFLPFFFLLPLLPLTTSKLTCLLGPLSPPVFPSGDLCLIVIAEMTSTLPLGKSLHYSSDPAADAPLPLPWVKGTHAGGACAVGLHWYRQPSEADVILATLGYPARRIYDECVKEGKWRGAWR